MTKFQWSGLICALFLGLALTSEAEAKPTRAKFSKSECTYFYKYAGFFNFYRQFFEPASCYLSLSPSDTNGMVFRSYLATNEGLLMIFNSYGEGTGPQFTGARDYYFFPRTRIPSAEVQEKHIVVRTAAEGADVYFNTETGGVDQITNAEVSVANDIHSGNKGGVEIKNFKGLMLDAGFALGKDPIEDKNRLSYFQDHTGAKCALKNSEIFVYGQGEIHLPADEVIKSILTVKCPQLKVLF